MRLTIYKILIVVLCASSCATIDNLYLTQRNKLWDSIKVFNNDFESKSRSACTLLVLSPLREDCLSKMGEFQKRVTISNSALVGAIFYRKGVPVKQSFPNPEEAFDEAVITHEYQVVVLPSNRVKTISVDQKWVLDQSNWYVIPNFKPFF